MRKLIYFTFLLCFILSCSSSSHSEYEKLLTDFIEIRGNVRTDLNVKFESIDISDITVGDSIQILKKQFETEKANLITRQEKEVQRYKVQISEIESNPNQDVVDYVMLKEYKRSLAKAELALQQARDWIPDYMTKYNTQTPDKTLVKKAICTFSIFDPKLQAKQTYKDALFILSADGKTPLRAILNE